MMTFAVAHWVAISRDPRVVIQADMSTRDEIVHTPTTRTRGFAESNPSSHRFELGLGVDFHRRFNRPPIKTRFPASRCALSEGIASDQGHEVAIEMFYSELTYAFKGSTHTF